MNDGIMYATYPGDKKSRLRRLYINFVVKIRPPDSQGHPYAVKILFARPYAVKIPFRIRPPDSQVVLIPSKFLFAYARQTHRSCLSRQNSFSHTPPPDSQVVLIRQNSFSHTVRPPDSQGRAYPVKIHFRAGGYERSIICLL